MSKRPTKSWASLALDILDRAESDVELAARFSLGAFADQCGVSRSTIWRHMEIRQRARKLVEGKAEAHQKASGGGRTRSQQEISRLRLRLELLTRDHNRLIQGYLDAYARLTELQIDPAIVFVGLDREAPKK